LHRALPLLLALLLAGCASDEQLWSTYQAAGEAAAVHARWDKAEGLLEHALAETSERPAERVRSQLALARVARERGDLGAARSRLAEARASAAALPPDAPEAARLALEEAWLSLDEGAAREAAEQFAGAELSVRRALGEDDPSFGWALAGRGEALRRSGDRSGARAALDEALDRFAGEASEDHVRPGEPLGVVAALISLGTLLREEGDLEGAREALHAAAALGGRELGTDHPRLAAALAELALVELERGNREAATRAATRAVEIAQSRLPDGHATRRAADEALAALGAP
jgi:hypothetical protein